MFLSCFLTHRVCSVRACSGTWRGSSVALFCWPAPVIRSVHDMGLANLLPWLWSRKQQVPEGQPYHSYHIAGKVSYIQNAAPYVLSPWGLWRSFLYFSILYKPCNQYTYREMSRGWVLINTESKQYGMKQLWSIITVFVQRVILERR